MPGSRPAAPAGDAQAAPGDVAPAQRLHLAHRLLQKAIAVEREHARQHVQPVPRRTSDRSVRVSVLGQDDAPRLSTRPLAVHDQRVAAVHGVAVVDQFRLRIVRR